jgi:hypothetical protein
MGALAGAAVSACQGSKLTTTPPPVVCETFASAQALCDVDHCDTTWAAVETNVAYCDRCTWQSWTSGDCGDYHVLDVINVDTGASYYYRRDTGMLVYAQFFSPPNGGGCAAVGTATFSPPDSCNARASNKLPGWCPPDAGVAGERPFPCCGNTIAQCNFDGVCPATWAEAQALAPSLCGNQTTRTNPEVGSCGGDHVFRYWYGATSPYTLPFTLYYDASGALIAGINETDGRCEFGPSGGLTLPACDAPLASACADGGAAP